MKKIIKSLDKNGNELVPISSNILEDISNLITPTSLVGTVYTQQATKNGKHIVFDIKCDVSNYGTVFTVDSSIAPMKDTGCICCNYSGVNMESGFVEISSAGSIYFSRNGNLEPYLMFHLEWDIN